MKMLKIEPPGCALRIIERLRGAGYEAYAVGGCVRDAILGRQPEDWDITTSALPEKVTELFPDLRVVPTGIKHGGRGVFRPQKTGERSLYLVDNRGPCATGFYDKRDGL